MERGASQATASSDTSFQRHHAFGQQKLEARIAAQRVEIRIETQPLDGHRARLLGDVLERSDGRIAFAESRERACEALLAHRAVDRVDRERCTGELTRIAK